MKEGKVPESFKSQPPPNYAKYSKKIVGSTFKKEIIESNKDQAIFFYSKHCHACKKYGGIYESFALENLRNANSTVEFNRMNSDTNHPDCFPNFQYTPIFMVLRKEDKNSPYIYRSQWFTPDLLKNFLDVTLKADLLPKESELKMLKNIGQGKGYMKNWKFTEVKN